MDQWKRDGLRSANSGLRNQVEHLLDAYERQQPRLADIFQQLESTRWQANSADRSIEVTTDATGVLTDLTLSASALRKTPDELAHAIVEVVQAAADRARKHHEAVATSLTADIGDMPDLPDIVPETPSLRDIRAFLRNSG